MHKYFGGRESEEGEENGGTHWLDEHMHLIASTKPRPATATANVNGEKKMIQRNRKHTQLVLYKLNL